jgi:predicted  nucleic acid-binding Zn-ribbon protein
MSEEIDRFINRVAEKPVRLSLVELKKQVIHNELALRGVSSKVKMFEEELSALTSGVEHIERELAPERIEQQIQALKRIRDEAEARIARLTKSWNAIFARLDASSFAGEIMEMEKLLQKWDRTRHFIFNEYKRMRKAVKSVYK